MLSPLQDDIPESDPDSCPHEGEVREDEDETEEESEDSDESEGEEEEEDEEEIGKFNKLINLLHVILISISILSLHQMCYRTTTRTTRRSTMRTRKRTRPR